jgi:hypothetical protein
MSKGAEGSDSFPRNHSFRGKSVIIFMLLVTLNTCTAKQPDQKPIQVSLNRHNFQSLLGISSSQTSLVRGLGAAIPEKTTDGARWLLLFYSTESFRKATKSKLALFQLSLWSNLASKQQLPSIRLGTVNCAQEQAICDRFGIVLQPELVYFEPGNLQVLDTTEEINAKNIQRLLDSLKTPVQKQNMTDSHASPLGLLWLRVERWFTVTLVSYYKPSVLLGNLLFLSFLVFAWSLVQSLLGESTSSPEEKQHENWQPYNSQPSL